MQALAVDPDVWESGVAEIGISDLSATCSETHQFGTQYRQPLCWSDDATSVQIYEVLEDRSPISRAANIGTPILIICGNADPICPSNQSLMRADKIKKDGTTMEINLYRGEGHVFVKAETLQGMEVEQEVWFRRHLT